jgi:hypothetical protein
MLGSCPSGSVILSAAPALAAERFAGPHGASPGAGADAANRPAKRFPGQVRPQRRAAAARPVPGDAACGPACRPRPALLGAGPADAAQARRAPAERGPGRRRLLPAEVARAREAMALRRGAAVRHPPRGRAARRGRTRLRDAGRTGRGQPAQAGAGHARHGAGAPADGGRRGHRRGRLRAGGPADAGAGPRRCRLWSGHQPAAPCWRRQACRQGQVRPHRVPGGVAVRRAARRFARRA